MTNKKFTDEEIKSSLEVIATTGNCNECKIRNCKWGTCNCSQITANAALDLINRQKAEIERYKGVIKILENDVANAKYEAIKEFAERLKHFIIPQKADGYTREIVLKRDIDNLVKEMTEVDKNDRA